MWICGNRQNVQNRYKQGVEKRVKGGCGQHGIQEPDCLEEETIAHSGSRVPDAAEPPRCEGGEESATMLVVLQIPHHGTVDAEWGVVSAGPSDCCPCTTLPDVACTTCHCRF